ncbi:Mucolipin-2, variant 4 [Dermatophagoides farinae]|uniref:Mucolipin-2, variant 4 n=1 Tax=Dermatophagoides farinae TaxID=6954 RepID=A0A922L2S5_DERFA|nr:Mucolipin-2, variant 4 [Dermatophagoides farinae]
MHYVNYAKITPLCAVVSLYAQYFWNVTPPLLAAHAPAYFYFPLFRPRMSVRENEHVFQPKIPSQEH